MIMKTQTASRPAEGQSAESRKVFQEIVPDGPRPLIRPASRSVMFGPLAVLIAILPGLYGLTHWDLTPPGPWWGLRGLAVLDEGLWVDQSAMAESIAGKVDYNTLRNIALQPPLFAWLEAILVHFSPTRSPLATVLPSYAGGVLLILLIYLQGRTWSKPGTAMMAVLLFAFHIRTLDAMQRAGPATLGAAMLVGALQFYSLHIQAGQGGRIRGRILYAMGCGACMGLSLMSVGLIGLTIIPVIGLHQVAINAGESPLERPRHWYEAWRVAPGLFYGATAFTVAMVIAAPWHVWMTLVHYGDFWIVLLEPSPQPGAAQSGSDWTPSRRCTRGAFSGSLWGLARNSQLDHRLSGIHGLSGSSHTICLGGSVVSGKKPTGSDRADALGYLDDRHLGIVCLLASWATEHPEFNTRRITLIIGWIHHQGAFAEIDFSIGIGLDHASDHPRHFMVGIRKRTIHRTKFSGQRPYESSVWRHLLVDIHSVPDFDWFMGLCASVS